MAKKKNLSEAKRFSKPVKKLNPFEVHINRQKFQVIGQKSKNDRGLPGVSRARAIKKRKATLLQEYKFKDKSNKFVDKRIGERISSMTQLDKTLARFTAEQLRAHKNKKTMYNLAEEEILTHKGRSLVEIEKYDDPRSDDEDDDEQMKSGGLDAKFVEDAHFGGGMFKKSDGSRATVIEQLIAESKKRKAEKQLAKEKTVEKTEALDAEWKDLLSVVSASTRKDEEVMKKDPFDILLTELKFEARGVPSNKLKSETEIAAEEAQRLQELEMERIRRMRGDDEAADLLPKHKSADDLDDGFDIEEENTFELMYDSEGRPIGLEEQEDKKKEDPLKFSSEEKDEVEGSDEEKTDEEGSDGGDESDEESDDLSDLKVQSDESSDDEEGEDVEEGEGKEEGEKEEEGEDEGTAVDKGTGDIEEKSNKGESESPKMSIEEGGMVVEVQNKEVEVEEETREKEETKEEKGATKEEEVKKNEEVTKKEETKKEEDVGLGVEKGTESEKKLKEKKKVSFNENILVQNVNPGETSSLGKPMVLTEEQISEKKRLIEQARKELPYTFKAPEVYEDLQKLFKGRTIEEQSVIVERLIKCHHPSLGDKNRDKLSKLFAFLMQHLNDAECSDCWPILDRLAPFLFDLSQFTPLQSAQCLADIIFEKFSEYEQKKTKYPSWEIFVFLKVVPLLFPTSDKRHLVATPAAAFIITILQTCLVKSRRCIASGLLATSLLIEYTSLSKRVSPEGVNFLCGLINMAIPSTNHVIVPPFKKELKFLCLRESCSHTIVPDLRMKAADLHPKARKVDNDFRVRSMYTTLNLLNMFANLYMTNPYASFIFLEVHKRLQVINIDNYPLKVVQVHSELLNNLENLMSKKITPLFMSQKKPKALRLYEPKIEPVYENKRHKSGSSEKAEQEKLAHKVKREMKGALREIRKDRTFLANVKLKEQAASDAERMKKVQQIYSWASEQQGELRKMKRKK